MEASEIQSIEIYWGGKVFRFASAEEARAKGFDLKPGTNPEVQSPPAQET